MQGFYSLIRILQMPVQIDLFPFEHRVAVTLLKQDVLDLGTAHR